MWCEDSPSKKGYKPSPGKWKWKSLSRVQLFVSPCNSPGQNTGVGSLSLRQRIFPTQGSNPGLLHCRWILYQLSHKGRARILEWVVSPLQQIFLTQESNWGLLRCRQILYQLSYQGSPGRDLLNRSDQILLLNSKAAKTPELSVIPHPVLPSAHLASMKLRSGFKTRDTVIKTGPIHVSSTSIRSGHQYPVTEDPAVVHPTWCMNQETETGIVFGYLKPHLPSPYLPHVHGPLHFILRREGSWGQCPSFILRTNLSGLSPLFSLRAASLYLHVPSVDNSLNAPSSNSQSHLSVQLSWDLKLHIQLHAPPILCSTRFLNLCHVLNQPSTCLPNCEFSLLRRFCKQWWQDKLEKKKINSSSCVVLCNLQCILQLDLTGDS